MRYRWLALIILTGLLLVACAPQVQAPAPTAAWPSPTQLPAATGAPTTRPPTPFVVTLLPSDCATVERLAPDSGEAQRVVEEFVQNFKAQQPTEYMGMEKLVRVDRFGDWAVVQGSIAGETSDVIVAHRTPEGFQIAAHYALTAPPESLDEAKSAITEFFLQTLPEVPPTLFACLEPTWFTGPKERPQPPAAFRLAYVGTDDSTTNGITEIRTIRTDGSEPTVLLHAPMVITGLSPSPNGQQIAFWGCLGDFRDCSPEEDLDAWVIGWDGTDLRNLTEDSAADDMAPDWSPDGRQIVFISTRSGTPQLYLMNADGDNARALTTEPGQPGDPKWSPDGQWIAYQCGQGGVALICLISPEGQPAGEPISGTTPIWSPDGAWLAYHCFEGSHSDICTARPDGSAVTNWTTSPWDEHSPAWSPDGQWLAFVSNRGDDVDVYKACLNCPEAGRAIRLTDEPRLAGHPTWAPDGSKIAYESGQDLMLVNADRTGATYLAGGIFSGPVWQPETGSVDPEDNG